MRATELIGLDVLDRAGQRLGVVIDLRCIQDGPPRGAMAALRLDSLLVSRRRAGSLLGYLHGRQQGPWLVRTILRQLHGEPLVVPWSAVRDHAGHVQLDIRRADLAAPVRSRGRS